MNETFKEIFFQGYYIKDILFHWIFNYRLTFFSTPHMTNDMLHGRKVLYTQVTKPHKRILANTISPCWQLKILGPRILGGCVTTESVYLSQDFQKTLFFEIILYDFRQFWCSFFGVSICRYTGSLAQPRTFLLGLNFEAMQGTGALTVNHFEFQAWH